MEGSNWAYNNGSRTPKDRAWFSAYVAMLITTAALGVLAWFNMNPLFHRAISNSDFMRNSENCNESLPRRRLLLDDDDFEEAFGWILLKAFFFSITPALAFGCTMIHLFRKHPQSMVMIGCVTPIVIFVGLAVAMFIATSDAGPWVIVAASPWLLFAGLLAFVLYRYRTKIQLVGRLMKVAGDSLAANPGLIPFALVGNVAAIPALFALGAVIFLLQGSGHVVSNPEIVDDGTPSRCEEDSNPACCAWQPEPWVLPAQVAVAVVLMWTIAIIGQLRTYVMGGVITQWYFHEETAGTIPRSLGHAMGPARGTLCFSAAVITVCNLVRSLVDRVRNNRGSPVELIIGCIFSWVIRMIEEAIRFISELATIQSAATGEGFVDAAKSVGSMLTRHRLSAVTVWWLPTFVLSWTLASVAMIMGFGTYFIAMAAWADSKRHQPSLDAMVLGMVVFYTFVVLTGWLLGFLRSATDVVYVCFARDLDNRAVTRPEVHEVLKEVPAASGAVVIQPDDNMMYGAMEHGDSPTAPLIAPAAQPAPAHDLTAAIESAPAQLPPKGDKALDVKASANFGLQAEQ